VKRFIKKIFLFFLSYSLVSGYVMAAQITPQDILKIPYSAAEYCIPYGSDSKQFGDLRLPTGKKPYPVLVVIHGGCWTSSIANKDFMSPFAQAFTKEGFATWNIEYRCIDNKGGGWPGTFLDIGQAIDYLRKLEPKYNLDLKKVMVIGHSSGGHLALWSGARKCLGKNSELYMPNPLELKTVINLAGPGDLRGFLDAQQKCCGSRVIDKLLDKPSGKMDEHLLQASPYEMLPLDTNQQLIVGDNDLAASIESMNQYLDKAKHLGDTIQLVIIKEAAHFEVVDPRTAAWQTVKDTVKKLQLKEYTRK